MPTLDLSKLEGVTGQKKKKKKILLEDSLRHYISTIMLMTLGYESDVKYCSMIFEEPIILLRLIKLILSLNIWIEC